MDHPKIEKHTREQSDEQGGTSVFVSADGSDDFTTCTSDSIPSTPIRTPVRRIWWWSLGIAIAVVVGILSGALIGFDGQNSERSQSTESSPNIEKSQNIEGDQPPEIDMYPGSSWGEDEPAGGPAGEPAGDENEIVIHSMVDAMLRESSIYGGRELDDPDSYQVQAKLWLEAFPYAPKENNGDGTGMTHMEHLLQRYALACIYLTTNRAPNAYTGEYVTGWTGESGWMQDGDECSWQGVSCTSEGRITVLNFQGNNLTGKFPPEIVHLKDSLQVLDLHDNPVHNYGQDNNFLEELTNLRYLYLSHTSFQYDGIPPAISKLTNLIEFDVSYSLYLGPIDESIFENMKNLEYLNLSGLSFHHEIPSAVAKLPNLRSLYASNSDVRGNLDFLKSANWANMYDLWFDQNPALEGTIPSELGTHSTSYTTGPCDCFR